MNQFMDKIKKIPTYNEAAKMFDLCDAYQCSTRLDGWTWDEAVKFIQEHWNDDDYNIDYENMEKS